MKTNVGFEKISDKNIFFSLSEPDDPQKVVVVMTHGFRGSSIGPARTFVDFERLLVTNGISSLRFDQPCSGNSEGDYLESSFNDWVKTTTYFSKKYLDLGYQVVLLGQSMGASTTMVATAESEIKGKIPCILLWVPDPKSTFSVNPNEVYEEGGQRYKGKFWQEARDVNFFDCMDAYNGGIHLVYGDSDRYISEDLRSQVVQRVRSKGQQYMILKGQDHSPWDYDVAQNVFREELIFLKKYLIK